MFKYLAFLLFPLIALGALTDQDKATLSELKNYALNGGAEAGKAKWTVSGTSSAIGDLVVNTSAASVYEGLNSFTWTPANADNFLTNAAVTITSAGGLSGRDCSAMMFTKTTATSHALEAYDGSNVLNTVTIPASTVFVPVFLNFQCPASGTVQIRLNAGATTAITFDAAKMGDARSINIMQISQAQFIGSAYMANTTNCVPTNSSATMAAFGADTDCPGPTVELNPGPGTIQTTDADGAIFTVNNLPPGSYRVSMNAHMEAGGSVSGALAISDGTDVRGHAGFNPNSTTGSPVYVEAFFTYTTAGNRTFTLFGSTSTGTLSIRANTGTGRVNFTITRFPLTSEQALRSDLSNPVGALTYAGTSNCQWSTTSASTANFAADTDCPTAVVTGSASAPGTKIPGAVFSNLPAGKYKITAIGSFHTSFTTSTTTCVYSLSDGTNTIGGATGNSTSGAADTFFSALSGVVTYSSFQSSVTWQAQGKRSGGGGTCFLDDNDAANIFSISLEPLDQSRPAPLLVGSVTSNTSGTERIERARITFSGGTPSVNSQSGTWISSLTDNGTGDTTANIAAGIFSATPACTCVVEGDAFCRLESASSTTVRIIIKTVASSPTATDSIYDFICMGPK